MATITTIFDEAAIAARVEALATEVAAFMPREFLIVALLKGSFIFVADLVRALDRVGAAPAVEFLRLSSYGQGRKSSGVVRVIGDPPRDVAGRAILLVDDIVDTGRSLVFARDMLLAAGAASVMTCALLDKPNRREVEIAADFVGFTVEDVFVVGYGVDDAEKYRHLPYIGTVD